MDIEGAEIEVFESCPWIEKVRVMAIELHDRMRVECSSIVKSAARDLHCDPEGEVTFFYMQPAEQTFESNAPHLDPRLHESALCRFQLTLKHTL